MNGMVLGLFLLVCLAAAAHADQAVLPDHAVEIEEQFPSKLHLIKEEFAAREKHDKQLLDRSFKQFSTRAAEAKERKNKDDKGQAAGLERAELMAAAYAELARMRHDPVFTKNKVSLRASNLSIRDLMKVVAQATGIAYTIDPDVSGVIGACDLRDVPASTLLSLLLDQLQPPLVLIKHQDVWRLLERDRALAQMTFDLLQRKQQSIALDSYLVSNAKWNDQLKVKVEKLWQGVTAGDKAGHAHYIFFDDLSRKVLFRGSEREIRDFRRCLEEIDVKVMQISLDARLVLANKNFEEAFGVSWSGVYDRSANLRKGMGLAGLGIGQSDFPGTGGVAQFTDLVTWSLNLIPAAAASMTKNLSLPITMANKGLNKRLNLLLNAAENRSEIRTLLKPSLLINDDEKAEILVGEEMPHMVKMEETVEGRPTNVTTTNYKDVGTKIQIMPRIVADKDGVWLDVFIEHNAVVPVKRFLQTQADEQSSRGFYDYTINTVRAKNRVFLRSGQTTMIGGLMLDTAEEEESGVPYLQEIPILGWLFKGKTKKIVEKQLLIFMTPQII